MRSCRRKDWEFAVLVGFHNDITANKKGLSAIEFLHEDFMFIVNDQQHSGLGDIHKTFSEIGCKVELIACENNTNSGNDIYLYRGKVLDKRVVVTNKYVGDPNTIKMSCCGARYLVDTVSTYPTHNYEIVLVTKPTERTTNLLRSMMAINVVGNAHVIVTSRAQLQGEDDL